MQYCSIFFQWRLRTAILGVCALYLLPGIPAIALDGAASALLAQIRTGHPRLMLLEADVPGLRRAIAEDPVLAESYRHVLESATGLLDAPVTEFVRSDRDNFLMPARQALDRIYRLGLAYRLEGDRRFAERGVAELMYAVDLDSWNPAHFLDTAELSHAAAIGYDWFFDMLDDAQRAAIVAALCEKGLREGAHYYGLDLPFSPRTLDLNWAMCNFNWNQVCNGGMGIGALAVAAEAPELAGYVLSSALRSLPRAMAEFAPDGGWIEGPGYWGYTTEYTVYLLAALESAAGAIAIEPILHSPGFSVTGDFAIHTSGPIGKTFNFADCHVSADHAPQMFWLARKFQRPEYAWCAGRDLPGAATPLDILWYSAEQKNPAETGLPLDRYFRNTETVTMRGAWEDRSAVFVGFKGGNNIVNHGHLDLGSFVLDADGCRWAEDPGSDNYALPIYFPYGRYWYFRLKTEGHNTLLLNGHGQCFDGKVSMSAFHSSPEKSFAVADLSNAYRLPEGQIQRGIALLNRRDVVVQDEFRLSKASDITWQLHTFAEVELDGPRATLRQGDKTLTVVVLEPEGAVFSTETHTFPPPYRAGDPLTTLSTRIEAPATEIRLTVQLSPGAIEDAAEIKILPLAQWTVAL